MDDSNIRRSDHSFRSDKILTEFGTPNLEAMKRDPGVRVISSPAPVLREPIPSSINRPGLFGHAETFARPQTTFVPLAQDRKLSIGSHDGVFLQPGQGRQPLANDLAYRGPLSDGGSVGSARRIERSSWYSNKNNDYDWTNLDSHDIKKFKVYSKGFYVVKTHVDNEVEQEFKADVWRETQMRQPPQVQVIATKAFDSIPSKLTLPQPTDTIEMDLAEIQRKYQSESKSQTPQKFESYAISQPIVTISQPKQMPTSAGKGSLEARRNWPQANQGRILNSEDFRQLLQPNTDRELGTTGPYAYHKIECSDQPIGKTEFGDEVYGFDVTGRPIIQIESSSRRPIFGFIAQTGSPVYGFSQYGMAQTHFDSHGRPVVGFDTNGYPVYDLKHNRIPAKTLDSHLFALLGYTIDKRSVYDVSSAGYLATTIDPATGQLVFGYDWKWRPVLEPDVRTIEDRLKTLPIVANDQFRNKIYGFDELKNPIYTFSKDRKPIYGFTSHHFPIMGVDRDGYLILTFDQDMKPVYGFRENFSPIYDSQELRRGQKLCFPPGIEFPARDHRAVFDVWGRQVDKVLVTPLGPESQGGANRKNSGNSADFGFYDLDGQQVGFNSLVLDESGRLLPDTTVITNSKHQVIIPGTPVYDKQGQRISKSGLNCSSKPVLDYTGKQIGVTYDGIVVLDHRNSPIATLSSTGKLQTLLPPADLIGYHQFENNLVNSQGKSVGQITPGNLIVDSNGIPFGKFNRLGQIELDEDLSKKVQKATEAKNLAGDFVPKLTLPNGQGKDALFSESDRNVSPHQKTGQANQPQKGGQFTGFVADLRPVVDGQPRFQTTKSGELVDTVSNRSLGRVEACPKILNVPFAAHVIKVLVDNQCQITGYIMRDGHILNTNGIPIGQTEVNSEFGPLQYFISEQGDSVTIFDPVKGVLMDAHGTLIAHVKGKSSTGNQLLVDHLGVELGQIASNGRISGKIQGIRVPPTVYDRILRGEKLPPHEITSIIELAEKSQAIQTSQSHPAAGKKVGGFVVDPLGRLLNESGQPVGKLQDGQLIGTDGKILAVLQADGTLKDLAGNLITESGSVVGRDGAVLGSFKPGPATTVYPLPPSAPVIADVEGHKVIGCTAGGDLVIGIDEQGKPILGKVGFNKDGLRIVAIDIDGKPLSLAFVEDLVKLSTAAASKSKQVLQQVVLEADEDMEDTDRIDERRRSLIADPRASSKYAPSHGKKDSDGEEEESGEEEDEDELIDQIGDGPGRAKDGGKLVKTESFVFVPKAADAETQAAEDARQQQFLAEMNSLAHVKGFLEQQILEQESKSNSPDHKHGRQD
jgi:hypothetical protein